MKILNHPAVIALGAATLFLLPLIAPLISPSHIAVYHTSGSTSTIFVSVLLNFFGLWALITALLVIAERQARLQVAIWTALTLAFPWVLIKSASLLTLHALPYWLSVLVLSSSGLSFVASVVLWQRSSPSFQQTRGFVAVVLGFVAFSGLVVLGEVAWFGWQARACNSRIVLHQRQTHVIPPAGNGRIIWILFDELSYQQVYEQRFPGLQLPAFDSIARESTTFTHVSPAGEYTENVVPSLMTGMPVDRIRTSADGMRLSLHDPVSRKWQAFDARRTVFQDALAAGYSTAIVGWYNPYCRIFSRVLDRCFWTSHLVNRGGMVANWSIARNTLQPSLRRFKSILFSKPGSGVTNITPDAVAHIQDYRELRDAADTTLSDPSANFVFLHMPIPHPPGIYDRQKNVLTTGRSSYIDNLALADSYLDHVHSLLQQRGEWDSSTVVIMGDHSWRTSLMWADSPLWTPEDQAASHGDQFDDRPAYIVKLPKQQLPARIEVPFNAIHTRALLDRLLVDQIKTSDDLASWVQQQEPPSVISH